MVAFQIVSIIVAIALLGIYVLLNRPQKIILADAGSTHRLTGREQRQKDSFHPFRNISLQAGKILQSRDYICVKVDGNCMEPRGIKNNSIVYVLPLNKKEHFKKQVRAEDVLLIYLPDKNVYKLRILQNYDNKKQLITYRYDENGKKYISSRSHHPDNVRGVVKYVMEK
jgi:hypothetical protein